MRVSKKPIVISLTIALALPPGAGQAADTAKQLDTMVVTATGREQPIQDVQASVEVIKQEQILRFPGASVTEVLRQAAGLDVRSSGTNSSVSIRGFLPNATLILFDGLRRPNKYGISNLNLFPPEDVERIEIIRGPMSALYGADAGGGVVNVITKRPDRDAPSTVRALGGIVTTGQRDTFIGGASVFFGTGPIDHRIGVDLRKQQQLKYDESSLNADLSGVDRTALTYSGAVNPASDHALRWTFEYQRQDDEADSSFLQTTPRPPRVVPYQRYEDEDSYFGSLVYVGAIGPGTLEAKLAYGVSDGETNRSFPVTPKETTDYRQTQSSAIYYLDLGGHALSLGGGWNQDKIDVSINSTAADRDDVFLLVQDQWRISPNWNLLAGVRYDDYTDFGSTVNPRASLLWNLTPVSLRVGYGTAFRAPTVLEQYSRFTRQRFIILGNPNLKPEESSTWEAAAQLALPRGQLEAGVYRSEVTDLIETVQPGTTIGGLIVSQYQNRSKATLQGVELMGSYELLPGLILRGSFDYIDARDGTTNERLTGRAIRNFKAVVNYFTGPWTFEVRGRFMRDLWAADPTVRGAAPYFSNYTVADLRVDFAATLALTAFAGIDNLFDQRTPANFASFNNVEDPGKRFFYMGARYAFK